MKIQASVHELGAYTKFFGIAGLWVHLNRLIISHANSRPLGAYSDCGTFSFSICSRVSGST
jgi:hypothetical protein